MVYLLIACVYVIAAMMMIKIDIIKCNQDLALVMEVQKKLKEEIEEKERLEEEEKREKKRQEKKEREKEDAGEPDGSEI